MRAGSPKNISEPRAAPCSGAQASAGRLPLLDGYDYYEDRTGQPWFVGSNQASATKVRFPSMIFANHTTHPNLCAAEESDR
jgi:hypothetical protein